MRLYNRGETQAYQGESDVIVSRVKLTHLADVLSPPKRTISYIGPHGLSRHASPARIAVFNSCFINRGIRAASDVRKSGPIGPVDHLVAARQSVGRERLVRHVTRTTYLPLLFLLLFSLMTITRPSLPLVRPSISPSPFLLSSSFAFALVRAPYRRFFALAADGSVLSQRGPTPRRRPDVSSFAFALTTFALAARTAPNFA